MSPSNVMLVEIMPCPLQLIREDFDQNYSNIEIMNLQNCGFDVSDDYPWFPRTARVQLDHHWLDFALWSRVHGCPISEPVRDETVFNYWARIKTNALRFLEEWKQQNCPVAHYNFRTGLWVDKFMTPSIHCEAHYPWTLPHYLLRSVDATMTFAELWLSENQPQYEENTQHISQECIASHEVDELLQMLEVERA